MLLVRLGVVQQPEVPAWFTDESVSIPEPSALVVASWSLLGLLRVGRQQRRQ